MMFCRNQKQDKFMTNMGRRDSNKEVVVVEDFLDFKDFKDLMVNKNLINVFLDNFGGNFGGFGMPMPGFGKGFGFTFERAEQMFNDFFNSEGMGMNMNMGGAFFDNDDDVFGKKKKKKNNGGKQ